MFMLRNMSAQLCFSTDYFCMSLLAKYK